MFGIRYIKFQPHLHVFKYRRGRIVREGRGLSFYYYEPTTNLVAVPVNSQEAPFIFSDGIEQDFLEFSAGSTATIGLAEIKGRLVRKG